MEGVNASVSRDEDATAARSRRGEVSAVPDRGVVAHGARSRVELVKDAVPDRPDARAGDDRRQRRGDLSPQHVQAVALDPDGDDSAHGRNVDRAVSVGVASEGRSAQIE